MQMSKMKSVECNPYDAMMEGNKKLQRDCNGRGVVVVVVVVVV